MKRSIILAGILVAAAGVLAGYINLRGAVLTATPAVAAIRPSELTNMKAARASVYVVGDATVFFDKNIETNRFVLTNAVPVAPGMSYTFRGDVESLCYATGSTNSEFHVAFE